MFHPVRVETKTVPTRRAGATPGPLDDGWRFGQHRRPKHYGRMPRKFPGLLVLQLLETGRSRIGGDRGIIVVLPSDPRNVLIELGNPERPPSVFILPLGRTKDGLDKEQCFVWLNIMFLLKI
jgi:hypothetical protein